MRIAFAAPATLSALARFLGRTPPLPGYPFAGSSALIGEYIELGHHVTLVTTSPGLRETVSYSGPNLDVVIVGSRVRARYRALDLFRVERNAITRELVRSGADVCHAHWTYEFALAAQRTTIPLLITVHDWAPRIAKENRHVYWRSRQLMQSICLRGRGTFTTPSPYLRELLGSRSVAATIVPNGVDLGSYGALGSLYAAPHVGMLNVGFSPRKNVQSALLAWPKVIERIPAAQLRLAGPGFEEGGEASVWAQRRGIVGGLNFLGALDPVAVPAFMSANRVFLHTSREESFGLAVVEAMAAGVPVVAGQNSGALPEMLKGFGHLIDIDAVSEIAGEVIDVLGQPDETLEYERRAGRLKAESFGLRGVATQYLSLLGGLMGSR